MEVKYTDAEGEQKIIECNMYQDVDMGVQLTNDNNYKIGFVPYENLVAIIPDESDE